MALEAVAHGLAGRRTDMEHRLRRAVELAPDDADTAAWTTGGVRGIVALLFEERAEALAAFARARVTATISTCNDTPGPSHCRAL